MRRILTLYLILNSLLSVGQSTYYSSPLKIPMLISGSFAELRSNHFHSGIDIKTQGTTGIPVYSVADGYISRLVVSPSGYGKALYINHPNGTTTVYGHLSGFSKRIDNYVKENQYRLKSFKIDLNVLPGILQVKQGDLIAKSGNSGSSGGPHLHFEIRDTKTEEPLNPLKYNFDIADKTPPIVHSLMLLPLSDTSHIKRDTRNRRFQIVKSNGKYIIENNPIVPVYGEVGFAIETNDYFDLSTNRCGVYSIQVTVDDELYYSHQLDQFSFNESRYINSHIEYETYIDLKRRFQKTWVEPGNHLSTYNYVKGNGKFYANGSTVHNVRIELKDTYGNKSVLEFRVKSDPFEIKKPTAEYNEFFLYKENNQFATENIELRIPEEALYDNLKFQYSSMPLAPGYFSEIHVLHKNTVPLHKSAEIKIKTKNLPSELQSKALLVNIDDLTGKYWAAGGEFENDWIKSKIKYFGHYAVKIDTTPPTIKPLSIQNNSTLTNSNQISFKISDDLSGIKVIEGEFDGKWVLFEYDAKRNLISHMFDRERFEFNKEHIFKLKVTDYKGNINEYKASFWK